MQFEHCDKPFDMNGIIAIQPDDYTVPGKPPESDASSPRWSRLLEAAGYNVRWVDVYRPDIIEQLKDCDAFMWRWAHFGGMFQIARRLLPVIERELGIPVYPDQHTCWHYDDKIAQNYLFEAHGIPAPKSWCWFSRSGALDWIQSAEFPLVIKLAGGAGSENVRLVRSRSEATAWIERLFDRGTGSLKDFKEPKPWPFKKRVRATGKALLKGLPPWEPNNIEWPLEKNYVLFQEFLPNNAFDTRVTVIGNRAFAFRRFNRENDFRASGSGLIDYAPDQIDPGFIRLAYQVAEKLSLQSCAIDGLYRHDEPVVGEISYTYVSLAVHDCLGHWKLHGDPETGALTWQSGAMWPEEAQIQDFLQRLQISVK